MSDGTEVEVAHLVQLSNPGAVGDTLMGGIPPNLGGGLVIAERQEAPELRPSGP
jgi:hypothetical protein